MEFARNLSHRMPRTAIHEEVLAKLLATGCYWHWRSQMLEKPSVLQEPDIGESSCIPSEHAGARKQNTFLLPCSPALFTDKILHYKGKIFKGHLYFCRADNKG